MSIRPLPDDVVAQIKSSTAIVSLRGVVLELVKNSLDAKASRIEVSVDFARGACTVEDDGLGIPPAEFVEEGGLGKRHCTCKVHSCAMHADVQGTSKFHSEEPHLGQHGTFLASLSAISLLAITSHHHAYRSHNSVSFHHAQVLERQTPTPTHNHVHGKHGTRVTVRNLFGNMPVRVKQRAMVVDQKTEQLRLRNALKRDTVGLLLGWQGLVSLKIRDGDGTTIVHINTSNTAFERSSRSAATERPRSAHLSSLLHILTQANYLDIDEWASWVPASASTPAITVKGAISLEPAPTKNTQFISIGPRPLSCESHGNELYDQVNRLFALSSFGTVEVDADVDEQEKLRRLSDKRYKHDGYTNRQLKASKGVDRFPMFYLRVTFKDTFASKIPDGRSIEDESNLQAIVDVFSAMVLQWLSIHHFRPRKPRQTSDRFQPATASPSLAEQGTTPSRKRQASAHSPTRSSTPEVRPSVMRPTKRHRSARPSLENSLGDSRSQAFADWSRIKSGKSSFFDTRSITQKAGILNPRQETADRPSHEGSSHLSSINDRQQATAFNVLPVPEGALSSVAQTSSSESEHKCFSMADSVDDTMTWTDPTTKKMYHINARTGCVMLPQRPQPVTVALSPSTTRFCTPKSLRIAPRSASAEPVKTLWLDHLLQTWDNPIFKSSEQAVQQLSLQDSQEDGIRPSQHNHMRCSHFDMQKAFNDAGSSSTTLSKDALRRAEVISQVDKKFILVRMSGPSTELETDSHADIMVLIDQHAADERIQVESLLHDLCAPAQHDEHSNSSSPVARVILEKPLHFSVSSREHAHFETFRPNFAVWSIFYDIDSSASLGSRPDTAEKSSCKLSVTALPPCISERCKADPELLISFLRSAIWKYVDAPPLPPMAPNNLYTSWVKKIATCPPGLVDMINSRACRSAIMFNDELSLAECRSLVSKLANCVFPFMCAHGRPSLVPIVDMGRVGGRHHAEEDNNRTFVDAWNRWKRP